MSDVFCHPVTTSSTGYYPFSFSVLFSQCLVSLQLSINPIPLLTLFYFSYSCTIGASRISLSGLMFRPYRLCASCSRTTPRSSVYPDHIGYSVIRVSLTFGIVDLRLVRVDHPQESVADQHHGHEQVEHRLGIPVRVVDDRGSDERSDLSEVSKSIRSYSELARGRCGDSRILMFSANEK